MEVKTKHNSSIISISQDNAGSAEVFFLLSEVDHPAWKMWKQMKSRHSMIHSMISMLFLFLNSINSINSIKHILPHIYQQITHIYNKINIKYKRWWSEISLELGLLVHISIVAEHIKHTHYKHKRIVIQMPTPHFGYIFFNNTFANMRNNKYE